MNQFYNSFSCILAFFINNQESKIINSFKEQQKKIYYISSKIELKNKFILHMDESFIHKF